MGSKHIIGNSPSGDGADEGLASVAEVSLSGPIGSKTKRIAGAVTEQKENRDVRELIPFVRLKEAWHSPR